MKRSFALDRIEEAEFARPFGFVRKVAPGVIEATGPAQALGELCEIETASGAILAEVAAVDDMKVVLMPLEPEAAIEPDSRVSARPTRDRVPVGDAFAGRAVDSLGAPIDGRGAIRPDASMPLAGSVPRPLDRVDPCRVLKTGISAIDAMLTLGEGQRIGIFAAAGVGKTTLVQQLASQVECDRCIVCLVGERGREVEALWRHVSTRDDSERFTVVAATSDQSAALRARSVAYALCLADFWRARGEHVLLMVDSVTRLAMALREIGLAAGAPPTVRAYTPNVFATLPRLVERCGAVKGGGSISAVMTVLSETDDIDDPIVEVMKSLLDGHIILSRTLAEQGQFPAIDVPRSVSRGADKLVPAAQARRVREAAALLSAYDEARVMIESGVYKEGASAAIDRAIALRPDLMAFLRQEPNEAVAFDDSLRRLVAIAERGGLRG